MRSVALVLKALASGQGKPSGLEIANVFLDLGWDPAGATSTPFQRSFKVGGVVSQIAADFGDLFVDFIIEDLGAPEDGRAGLDDPEVYRPFKAAYDEARNTLMLELADYLLEDVSDDVDLGALEFVEGASYKVESWLLSIGLLQIDEDDPVLIGVRLAYEN